MSVSTKALSPSTSRTFQRRGLSLRLRLVLLMVAATLPVFIIIAATMYTEAQRLLIEFADNQIALNNHALKENVATWLDLNAEALQQLAASPAIVSMDGQQQRPYLQAMTAAHPEMYLVSTLNLTGVNVARSDKENLTDYSSSKWFQAIRAGAPLAFETEVGVTTGRPAIVAAAPISQSGKIVGAAMFSIDLSTIIDQVKAAKLGRTGYVYVVDDKNFAVAHPNPVLNDFALHDLSDEPAIRALRTRNPGLYLYTDNQGVVWHTFLDTLPNGWGIVAQQSQEELLSPLRTFQAVTIGAFVISVLLLAAVSWFAIGRALKPVQELASVAGMAARGNLNVLVPVKHHDEVGALAVAFNTMVARLRELIGSLEHLVQARTDQLRASADVGRAAASVLDTEQLIHEVVNLITDRFDFYYVAIFLADSTQQWAVLQEATGEAGRILKERNHRLEIGGQSMVGTAMKTRQSRIALDVGAEAVRFANPLLPETRSEIALPLIAGNRTLGALDVQSTQAGAFDEASAAVLQSMADQIAIALNNANQFQQTELALQRTNTLYTITRILTEATTTGDILWAIVNYTGVDANWSGLFTYGPRRDTGELEYVEAGATWVHPGDTQTNAAIQPGTRFSPEQMPFVDFLMSNQPLIVSDVLAESVPLPLRDLMQQFGAKAMIALPLVVGETPLGALVFSYQAPRLFDADQTQALMTLARQIAIVLQNQQSLQASQAALTQLDQVNRQLIGKAWQEYTQMTAGGLRKVKMGYGVPPIDTEAPLPSTVTAPVVVNGVEIGALRLEDAAPDRTWTSNEVSLLQSIASEVSLALERARLVEQTERRAEREARLNRIAQRLRQTTSIRAILQTAAEELGTALDTSHAQAQIGKQANQERVQR